MFDFGVLQLDAFMLEVLSKVLLAFGFVVTDPGWPPAGFLLDFQPGVDVVSQQSLTSLVKLPDLVDVLDFVSQVHRFVQFRAAPCPGQGALLVAVVALAVLSQGRLSISSLTQVAQSGKRSFPAWR